MRSEFCNIYRPMKLRRIYEELLKQERRAVLRLKCLSGATALLFFAVFLMTFLGIDVVQKLGKGFAFESGKCVVKESIFTGENISCNCGMHTCFSRYPCLRILVRISGQPEQSQPILLYNTFYDLIGSECTYGPPCKPSEEENLVFVLDFKNKHGQKGTVLKCFYNRNKHTEVILDNSAHKMVTFHVFFWPSCVFFLGLCMLIKVYCLKRTQAKQVFMPQNISFATTDNNNVYNYHETNESP